MNILMAILKSTQTNEEAPNNYSLCLKGDYSLLEQSFSQVDSFFQVFLCL